MYRICDSVVRSGQEYVARKSNSRQRLPPLMYSYYDTEYLGGNSTYSILLKIEENSLVIIFLAQTFQNNGGFCLASQLG